MRKVQMKKIKLLTNFLINHDVIDSDQRKNTERYLKQAMRAGEFEKVKKELTSLEWQDGI